jgi:prevent-host-death family protein
MSQAVWKVAEAKARLAQVLREADREPQEITKRGKTIAVVVNAAEYRELLAARGGVHQRTTITELRRAFERIRKAGPGFRTGRRHDRPMRPLGT